jgi:hypothetical protein
MPFFTRDNSCTPFVPRGAPVEFQVPGECGKEPVRDGRHGRDLDPVPLRPGDLGH